MTDLEINKALALAIGWNPADFTELDSGVLLCCDGPNRVGYFDYQDWNVTGPIAARYDCFPYKWMGKWEAQWERGYSSADTPQKAIALAVIEGAKK